MDDQQFSQLLQHHWLSRTGYRKVMTGVKKRIARHMQEHHLLSDPAGPLSFVFKKFFIA